MTTTESRDYSADQMAVGFVLGAALGLAHMNLGQAFMWSDQSESAIAAISKAIELGCRPSPQRRVGS